VHDHAVLDIAVVADPDRLTSSPRTDAVGVRRRAAQRDWPMTEPISWTNADFATIGF
jgi:hypothetical protein